MILVVLLLACTITLAGGFIVGVLAGAAWQRGRGYARGIATYEAARLALGIDR